MREVIITKSLVTIYHHTSFCPFHQTETFPPIYSLYLSSILFCSVVVHFILFLPITIKFITKTGWCWDKGTDKYISIVYLRWSCASSSHWPYTCWGQGSSPPWLECTGNPYFRFWSCQRLCPSFYSAGGHHWQYLRCISGQLGRWTELWVGRKP